MRESHLFAKEHLTVNAMGKRTEEVYRQAVVAIKSR
jgi:hypothetical protein